MRTAENHIGRESSMKFMKTKMKELFLLPGLIAVLNLLPAGQTTAQTFTTLHSFTAGRTNSSGAYANTCAFTIYVKGAAEQISDLTALVKSFTLESGTETSL